jgi:hypothetical protein
MNSERRLHLNRIIVLDLILARATPVVFKKFSDWGAAIIRTKPSVLSSDNKRKR